MWPSSQGEGLKVLLCSDLLIAVINEKNFSRISKKVELRASNLGGIREFVFGVAFAEWTYYIYLYCELKPIHK